MFLSQRTGPEGLESTVVVLVCAWERPDHSDEIPLVCAMLAGAHFMGVLSGAVCCSHFVLVCVYNALQTGLIGQKELKLCSC